MDRNLRIRMLLEAADRATRPLRDIAGGGRAAAEALKTTRDALKRLDDKQQDINAFRALRTGLADTRSELVQTRARVTAARDAIARTEKPTRAMTRELRAAEQQLGTLTRRSGAQVTQLGELRTRLSQAGMGVRDLASHERTLQSDIARTNTELAEQTNRLQQADARARRFGDARRSFGRTQGMATGLAAGGASGIATGLALSRPIAGAVEQAQEFESVMTDIAQKANLTRTEAAGMGRELLEAARAANQLPEALQQGVDTLSGFGLDPRQAARMMTPIGRAATAYKAEIADLSAAAFAGVDNLKIPIEQTGRLIDIMAQAGKEGAFEVRDMAGSFPALTAAYQGLGQSGLSAAADLSAAAQIVRKGTGDSASAATNLQNILQKINAPATIRAFKKNYGVDLPAALRQAYAQGKTPLEAIAELTAKTLGGDLSKLGFLFEDAQVQQGLRPLIQNMEEYRRIREAASGASGVTDADFAERMRDSAEASRAMTINTQQLGITLGTQLMPTVNAARNRIADIAGRLNGWAQRHPRLSKAIVISAAVLAGLLVLLGGGAIALAAIMMPIAVVNAGLIAMGVAGGLASIGLLPIIGTVLAVIAIVALLGAAIYTMVTKWDEVKAGWFAFWGGIRAGIIGAWNWLKTTAAQAFADAGRMMMQGLLYAINPAALVDRIVGMGNRAVSAFKAALGIRSPSRVFMEMGGHIVGGLIGGLDRGEGRAVGRIRRLTRNMAAAAAIPSLAVGGPAFAAVDAIATRARDTRIVTAPRPPGGDSPASGGGQRAAPTYHITINAAPGQSPRDLARAVSDELDRRERRRASDARASYRDDADGADR